MDSISSHTEPLLLALHHSDRSSIRPDSRRHRRRRGVRRKEPKQTTLKDIAKQVAVLVSFLVSCYLIDRLVYLMLQDSIDPFHETNLRGGEQILVEQQLFMPQQRPNIEAEYYDTTGDQQRTLPMPHLMINGANDRTLDNTGSNCIHCNDTFPLFFFGANDCTELTSEQYDEFCNSDTSWVENRFCQESCFNAGIQYDGEPACCGSSAPSSSPTISHSPSTSPSRSNQPSGQPSNSPTLSHAPSHSPTGSPTKQVFMPSGDMKYNNTEPEHGPWAECMGWEGQDCRDYINTLVDDNPKFEFFGLRWRPDAENATTGTGNSNTGSDEETVHTDGEGGNYEVLGLADEDGTLVPVPHGPKQMHRVVVLVNNDG
eukprot:CAMPEP_0194214308 /NCGR_PEP_ID=MMETSP0156-20130528/15482_1 /TAXON_ID=33649 /ORGANISM="Thalassionema nitzschioides, Strain L26-B" /LENGTH=370 /DNA_ID=CAMNT_0038942537 /DNA_START=45 /DNA_END=1153 /DNA_ORIENTATION=+